MRNTELSDKDLVDLTRWAHERKALGTPLEELDIRDYCDISDTTSSTRLALQEEVDSFDYNYRLKREDEEKARRGRSDRGVL